MERKDVRDRFHSSKMDLEQPIVARDERHIGVIGVVGLTHLDGLLNLCHLRSKGSSGSFRGLSANGRHDGRNAVDEALKEENRVLLL